jgi:uncharacterized protein with ParB-like and HNH nuclease domain
MPSQIDSDKILIKDILAMWFRVPEYQRPYVWETDQVNDLLEDVTQALEMRRDSEYFLGAIVLQKRLRNGDDGNVYDEYDLLDGQQRLATCLMVHAVGRDLAQDARLKESCRRVVFQEENPFDGTPERLRIEYEIRPEVRDFVNAFLKPDGGTDDEAKLKDALDSNDVSVRNMANALLEIRRYFKEPDAPSLADFFSFFRNRVLMIYVSSTELDDAFRLFTVLNDRGMKLRGSDILKTLNLRALRAEGANDQEQRQAAQMWEEMEGELGEDFDVFLAHLRTVLVKEKARLSLLQEFEENIYEPKEFDKQQRIYRPKPPIIKPGRDTFNFVRRYRRHNLQIFSGSNYALGNSWEFDNTITLLDETALADFWVPPILHYREVFGEDRLVEFVRKLENKFSGDWIARETPTRRIEGMNTLLKSIDTFAQMAELTTADKIDRLLKSSAFHFDQAEFFKQLENSSIYGRRFARYILFKLDMIFGGPNNRLQSPKEISVEHILPQNPERSSQWCKSFNDVDRAEWTNRLGNLVLISGRKNSAQGRLDFADKKAKYFSKNIETFPNSLRVMNNNTRWDLAALKANHRQVLARLRAYYQ